MYLKIYSKDSGTVEMEKNFRIDMNSVDVHIEGEPHSYDLHNLYDFKKVCIHRSNRSVFMVFEVNPDFKKKIKGSPVLTLKFYEVIYFQLSPCFVFKISDVLQEIGYKSPGDMDDDWLLGEEQATKKDHLFFRFEHDEFIRIHSKNALATPSDLPA